ncbi:hypothetical protein DLM75_18905 [Leptospira stimsonii]|uniref:Uncharacterized protein n=1 Tax=Leptospira stimsonii TaxID=2202203 RepID=A0A396YZY7_9LEPT|nr:hypothetical protein DLM75_18905 [Leptospira stimsonii]
MLFPIFECGNSPEFPNPFSKKRHLCLIRSTILGGEWLGFYLRILSSVGTWTNPAFVGTF